MSDAFDLEQLWFENSEIKLHAVAAGPKHGPVVILLHGFPEFWYGWRKQIGPLAAAGFRVIAPDQRGYNTSSKPSEVRAYAVTQLVSDVIAIIDQLGKDRVYVAGHDWGAVVAWSVALLHPERVARLGILNVPHPVVIAHNLRTNPRQWLKSWYAAFFQLPWLPELLLSANNFAFAKRSLATSSRPGTFSSDDLERHAEAWSQTGALTAMINWYRALLRFPASYPDPQVRVPTRILWGKQDAFLLPEEAQESLQYCADGELTYFPDATHWIQHEEAERVNEMLIEFFKNSCQ